MEETGPVSTKKCPFCQQWSVWQQQPTDRCTHCGHLLDPQALAQQQEQAAAQGRRAALQVRLLEIHPEDRGLRRLLKRVGRGGQLLFIGLVSFVVWLVTVLTL